MASNQGLQGFATLGEALGGGAEVAGANAYDNGLRVGATTTDAIAQAKDRIQKTQAASQAAAALRSPALQQQLNLTPEQAELAATQAEQGMDVEHVFSGLATNQKTNLQRQVAVGGDAGRHAAMALDPASGAMHGLGDNGTFIDPFSSSYSSDNAPGGANTPVSVSPLQAGATAAKTNLDNAAAAAAPVNAAAHTVQANKPTAFSANGGLGKPPVGMRWKMNDDMSGLATDESGTPGVLEPIPGADNKPEPATSARFHSNTVLAGGNLANEVENIQHLGSTTTLGATGIHSMTPGVMNTLKQNLGNSLSDSDQQNYNTSTNQLGRFIGVSENGGRAVPESLAAAITNNLANVPSNTESARLVHLGSVKQAAQAADDTLQATTASAQLKALSAKNRARVEASIPFNVSDAIDFGHSGRPNQTFQQFLDARKPQAAAAPTASAPPAGYKVMN